MQLRGHCSADEKHEVGAGSIARGILAANAALQRRSIVLATQPVTRFPLLSPDVAEYFPDDQSVNTALRKLIRVAK